MTALPTMAGSLRVLPVVLFGRVAAVVVARAGRAEARLMPTTPARWAR
ncbi:MAG: hypothetical protein ABW224_03960 [Kibdelosporangium sp.]